MTTRLNRGLATLGVLGLGAGGALAVAGAASPALGFTGTCPTTTPAATLVADNVCEVRFTTAGDYTFTVPSGVSKLSAVLVGAGGGGGHETSGGEFPTNVEYAGGGGDVQYVDSVAGSTVSIHVGTAGSGSIFGPGGNGEATQVATSTANGGLGGTDDTAPGSTQGFSGSGLASGLCHADPNLSLGGGAKTAATNTQADCAYGAGLTIAGLSGIGASTLFPAGSFESTVYGNGGSVDAGPAGTTDPGSGGSVVDEEGQSGADGLVILRFAALPPKPELAATGMGVSTAIPALGAFALAGGAVLLALSRRRSRRA